jgi:hypothetical protein
MSSTRTGWIDLYTAQVLWAKILSRSNACPISIAPASQHSARMTFLEVPHKLPSKLGEELTRLADRAGLVASCTCDFCGKPALPGSPRCSEHLTAAQCFEPVDADEILADTSDPMVWLERMSEISVDVMIMGPTDYVLDMMDRDDRLYAAICTRNELADMDDPWGDRAAQLVMQADRRHTRRARSRLRYADGRTRYKPFWALDENAFWCQGETEAYDFLAKNPMMEAIARTCVQYQKQKLSKNLRDALAMLDADRARSAIANIC